MNCCFLPNFYLLKVLFMKAKSIWVVSILLLCALSSCRIDEQANFGLDQQLHNALESASGGKGTSYYLIPESHDYAAIPQDPRNPLTNKKVELGRLLFHETAMGVQPRISGNENKYSCASCHHAAGGFQANLLQGIGEGGIGYGIAGESRVPDPSTVLDSIDVQQIRTPSALNIAFQEAVLWNGQFGGTGINRGTEVGWVQGKPTFTNYLGYEGVETQAIAGLKVHRMDCDSNIMLGASIDYRSLFAYAFPELPEASRYSREYAGLAIAAYERTILANRAPFQLWLKGDQLAMTEKEKEGAILFFTKAQCYKCHNGPALNAMAFYGLGMPDLIGSGIYGSNPDDDAHKGRGGFTKRSEDMYKFKVPQLYNLKDSPFLGHGGNFHSVREVVNYKNRGLPANPEVPATQLAAEFVPLGLTDQEVGAIVDFIEKSLYDPQLNRFEPASVPSGQCFPNNDLVSSADRGCD